MTTEKKKSLIIWLAILTVIAGIAVYKIRSNRPPSADEKIIKLAQCLTQKGAKMYGAFWCAHCQNQKKTFGKAWQDINYIECSLLNGEQNELCRQAGIEGYPTWEFGNGQRESNELTFQKLAELSQCPF